MVGLSGTGLVLEDEAADDLMVSTSGSFVFSTPVASGKPFDVAVLRNRSRLGRPVVSPGERVSSPEVTSRRSL